MWQEVFGDSIEKNIEDDLEEYGPEIPQFNGEANAEEEEKEKFEMEQKEFVSQINRVQKKLV